MKTPTNVGAASIINMGHIEDFSIISGIAELSKWLQNSSRTTKECGSKIRLVDLNKMAVKLEIESSQSGRDDALFGYLISSTSLMELSFSFHCTLNVPPVENANCFQNLKTLCLCKALIGNDNIQNTPNNKISPSPLLLKFRVLEYLELKSCSWSQNAQVETSLSPTCVMSSLKKINLMGTNGQVGVGKLFLENAKQNNLRKHLSQLMIKRLVRGNFGLQVYARQYRTPLIVFYIRSPISITSIDIANWAWLGHLLFSCMLKYRGKCSFLIQLEYTSEIKF